MKVVNLTEVREGNPQKRLLKVEFQKRENSTLQPEMYVEKSRKVQDAITIELTNTSADYSTLGNKLEEDVVDGGYYINLGERIIFLNYAETLDLYILLDSLYKKDDGISSITSLLD